MHFRSSKLIVDDRVEAPKAVASSPEKQIQEAKHELGAILAPALGAQELQFLHKHGLLQAMVSQKASFCKNKIKNMEGVKLHCKKHRIKSAKVLVLDRDIRRN